tara:strand:- start:1188 stop:1451 length:264 start_codon:yes stop_codon:yes gene_type:complete
MIDEKYKVRRYIAEYSEETEELMAEYYLSDFDLAAFQKEFYEPDPKNPMFNCYPITADNLSFIRNYIENEPDWDFENKSYSVEAFQA